MRNLARRTRLLTVTEMVDTGEERVSAQAEDDRGMRQDLSLEMKSINFQNKAQVIDFFSSQLLSPLQS